jgi:signal transduction histidine kinase
MWFSFRVSRRISRLRDKAEAAIDARGHIQALLPDAHARDEIGDLSRSFSAVLARLSQQQNYLETLADRLSHELRTPVAVVRSSLENLRLACPEPMAQTYVGRAEDGLARLSAILNRMSEATRLEQSLQNAESERYELGAVIAACVQGYRSAWPQVVFELALPATAVMVEGSPDLLAQMLDKLIDNAVDYHASGTPVRISLELGEGEAQLGVANAGPVLSDQLAKRLFNAMVSVREGRQTGGMHLGLGLYVARLIARFHGGRIAAVNLADGSGVEIQVQLTLAGRKAGEDS